MQKTIVSDTSCLILLDKINQLDLLHKIFGEIIVTKVVADEYGKKLLVYIQIENPQNQIYQKILENLLDAGEASAMALALEKKGYINSLTEILEEIKKIDFRLSQNLIEEAKKRGGE